MERVVNVGDIELKPCPFCGGVPTMLFNQLSFDRIGVKVVCGLCLASIQRDHSDENEATALAVMSWNRRVSNDGDSEREVPQDR